MLIEIRHAEKVRKCTLNPSGTFVEKRVYCEKGGEKGGKRTARPECSERKESRTLRGWKSTR